MELWIRSQDRTQLATITGLILVDCQIRGFTTTKDYYELGTYKTKERALEVLDEIQKKINLINLGHDFGSPMIDLDKPTYIYKMPKE